MTEDNRVPELRFPEFSGEWEVKQLGQLVRISSGDSPSNYKEGGNIPLFKVKDLNNNIKYQKKSELNVYKSGKLVQKDSIIFPKRGAAILTNKVRILRVPGYMDSNLMALNFEYNEEFFYQLLLKEGLYKIADTSTIPQINNKHIIPYKITIPSKKEQQKIGEFFSKLDRQIELEEKKLALLEEQKKGYMQKIFSQELRFKDENGEDYPEWEETSIGSVLKERTEKTVQGDLLSVTINEGIKKFEELNKKNNSNVSAGNYKAVYKNDIAYNSMRMWQGASGLSNYNGHVSPAYTVLKNNINLNMFFISLLFKTDNMIYKFKKNSQGLTSDTWNLKYPILSKIDIKICTKLEQDKIAKYMKLLDSRMHLQRKKIDNLKIEKKELLNAVFI